MAVCSFGVPCRTCYKYRMSRISPAYVPLSFWCLCTAGKRLHSGLIIPLLIPKSIFYTVNMAGGATEGISAKRAELTGNKVGWRGPINSKKTFGIALFASLGGLVYGCEPMLCMLRDNRTRLTSQTTKECSRKS